MNFRSLFQPMYLLFSGLVDRIQDERNLFNFDSIPTRFVQRRSAWLALTCKQSGEYINHSRNLKAYHFTAQITAIKYFIKK